jgi:hypothetical protein
MTWPPIRRHLRLKLANFASVGTFTAECSSRRYPPTPGLLLILACASWGAWLRAIGRSVPAVRRPGEDLG